MVAKNSIMKFKDFLCRVFGRLGITKNYWPTCLLEYGNMLQFEKIVGYKFDLNNPKTLSEKIQWYKSRYERPDMVRYVDKYLFKGLIEEKLGGDIQFHYMELGRQ